jgi:hypothetical protein
VDRTEKAELFLKIGKAIGNSFWPLEKRLEGLEMEVDTLQVELAGIKQAIENNVVRFRIVDG